MRLMPERELFVVTTAEAAEMVGVSQSTIRRWADRGYIPSWTTPSRERRFRTSDIRHFLAKYPQPEEVQ